MSEKTTDFRRLAEEAAQEAYSPRGQRCWIFHRWTMWEELRHPIYPSLYRMQKRRCVRCGEVKYIQKYII